MKRKLINILILAVLAVCADQLFRAYDNYFPYGRMLETPGVRPHEESVAYMAPGRVPWNGGEAEYRDVPGDKLVSTVAADDVDAVKKGGTLYGTYCMQCHGKYHDGNGTVGQSFAPLPADLQSAKVQALSDGVMFKEISYGKTGGRQPALDTTISIPDRWLIVAYVKSLSVR